MKKSGWTSQVLQHIAIPRHGSNHTCSKCNLCLLQGNAVCNSEKWESLKRKYIFYCFLTSIDHFCWSGERISHWSKGKWKKTACYGKFSAAEIFHVYAVSAIPCHYCAVLCFNFAQTTWRCTSNLLGEWQMLLHRESPYLLSGYSDWNCYWRIFACLLTFCSFSFN